METEILDEYIVVESRNEIQFFNFISIIILWVGMGCCFWFGLHSDPEVIFSLLLLSLATLVMYYNYARGIKITFGIISLGIFSLVTYSPFNYSISIAFGSISVTIEVVFFVLLLIHYFTNRKVLTTFLMPIVNVFVPELEEEKESTYRRRIENYKIKLSIKSTFELENLLKENNLVPEALKAVEEILKYRNHK